MASASAMCFSASMRASSSALSASASRALSRRAWTSAGVRVWQSTALSARMVQRSARIWARTEPQSELYLVREANGQERVEYLPGQGGRWLVKAKGAPYGYAISKAVVDEAWNVETNYIEEGVAPTMVEAT